MAEDNHVMDEAHHAPALVKMSPFLAMLAGLGLAWLFYIRRPELPGALARQQHGLYQFLLNKWYFDELYDFLFVRPCQRLARTLWKVGDAQIIDGMPNGAASLTVEASRGAVKLQTGKLANYAFAMIIGLALFVSIFLLGVMR